MGKQLGIFPLRGTIGDVSFYSSPDGLLFRKKPILSRENFFSDPRLDVQRRNSREFGIAARAGKLLMDAISTSIKLAKDRKLTSRLLAALLKAARKDLVNLFGERNPANGNLYLLNGFEFNANIALQNALKARFTTRINRVTGEMEINIPAFIPNDVLSGPQGATHFRLISAATEFDPVNNSCYAKESLQDLHPLNAAQMPMLKIVHQLGANSTHPILLLLGVAFYMVVNDEVLDVGGVAGNALSIVAVDMA